MKKHKILLAACSIAAAFIIAKKVGETHSENSDIDKDNPYIINQSRGQIEGKQSVYISIVKPAFDKALSFMGLVILSPLFVMIATAVYLDDPGPVFFTQKRVGLNGSFFMLHKFRTLKMSTPSDVPTHELKDPEQYITRVGRMLRKTSLDELPQIWDIWRGRMSVIGPRPALWNQDDLVECRASAVDGVDANAVLPGLTGAGRIIGTTATKPENTAFLDLLEWSDTSVWAA